MMKLNMMKLSTFNEMLYIRRVMGIGIGQVIVIKSHR